MDCSDQHIYRQPSNQEETIPSRNFRFLVEVQTKSWLDHGDLDVTLYVGEDEQGGSTLDNGDNDNDETADGTGNDFLYVLIV